MTTLGIDVLLKGSTPWKNGERVALLCNQASMNRALIHSRLLLQERYGDALRCLFSPQHGFHAEKQDNMIESVHTVDSATGLPIYSLYGESRKPNREMCECFDVLLIDLVDVGTRVYTFLYTMAYCLEAAARYGKKVVVLDRPNPIGGLEIEGNVLESDYRSFVGLYPLPMRHGLTFGELARYLNLEFKIAADLTVVPMQGWHRSMYFRDTGLPWVFPSPNMPTPETALVYPGQVIWEGTTVSEGRGTAMPFELTGAPYWRTAELLERIDSADLAGVRLRPLIFEPTSGKWAGEACHGFQLHVLDPQVYKPYRTSLALLQAVLCCYPEAFSYKDPPYEYEFETLPMDLILGSRKIRKLLEGGTPIREIEASWKDELQEFAEKRCSYFLY